MMITILSKSTSTMSYSCMYKYKYLTHFFSTSNSGSDQGRAGSLATFTNVDSEIKSAAQIDRDQGPAREQEDGSQSRVQREL